MDSYNNSLYKQISENMAGTSSAYSHNEALETGMINRITKYRRLAKDAYYRSILNPEFHLAKIPSPIPVSSTVATLRDNFTITPNASGKFLLVIDPFYNKASLFQGDDFTGLGPGTVTNITFGQDNTIIDQYRLVSSSVILKYYGNFTQMAGLLVAATTSNVTAATVDTYKTVQNIEDLTNKRVVKCIDGIKMIYCPIDDKATEFTKGTDYAAGTHQCRWQYLFVIYGDLFPNTSCIRVDYFRNIEYTTVPAYREYITQSKELPCEYAPPVVESTVMAAPDISTTVHNTSSWFDRISSFANSASRIIGPVSRLVGSFI